MRVGQVFGCRECNDDNDNENDNDNDNDGDDNDSGDSDSDNNNNISSRSGDDDDDHDEDDDDDDTRPRSAPEFRRVARYTFVVDGSRDGVASSNGQQQQRSAHRARC